MSRNRGAPDVRVINANPFFTFFFPLDNHQVAQLAFCFSAGTFYEAAS
jgi:hypothetical protein